MPNRILAFVRRPCACCCRLREVEAILDRQSIEAERLEALCGKVVEYWLPDAERVVKPRPDDDADDLAIRLILSIEPDGIPIDGDLAACSIVALRALARELDAAALAMEGGAE